MDRFKPYGLLTWRKPVRSRGSASFFLIVFATALLAPAGCNRTREEFGAYPVAYHTSSLPDVTLTDQYGQHVPLASLKGKPLLFDFIYSSCPGPCQLLTQHMKLIADKLGAALGPKVSLVSVTVDPEHDRRAADVTKVVELGPGNALARMMHDFMPDSDVHSLSEFHSLSGFELWVQKPAV